MRGKTNLEIIDRCHYCQYLIRYWKNYRVTDLVIFLQQNNILYEFQFGFGGSLADIVRSTNLLAYHYSTILAIMEVTDNIYNHLDHHEYVIGILLDLQKALGTVNHYLVV